jgi:hypothetical protein
MATQLVSNSFLLEQSEGSIEADPLLTILSGSSPAYLAKHVVSRTECDQIWQNFQRLSAQRRHDNVPGIHIGGFHYGKTTDEYLAEVEENIPSTTELVSGTSDPISAIHEALGSALEERTFAYRPASSNGRLAGRVIARSWTDGGEYALAPHEDRSQLQHPAQRGFEIQQVWYHTVVGVNLCIRSNDQSGALLVWNKRPDEEERLRLGVEHLGYPYPPSFVEGHEYLRILPEPGDIYCVNGTLLHAVEKQPTNQTRLSLSFIIGFIDDATVIHWT